jgi:2-iminobutanoate/2-iminopropanoate deaminase
MIRKAVSSGDAPAALGPYSQAIVAGEMVFCSGMAGIDPVTGEAADGIEEQTEQALLNLTAVLGAAGCSMEDVVKTTIFYADVEDFGRLNEVYARYMPGSAASALGTGPCAVAARPACLDRGDRDATELIGLAA